jgi:hypothetical protein
MLNMEIVAVCSAYLRKQTKNSVDRMEVCLMLNLVVDKETTWLSKVKNGSAVHL